MGCGLPPARVSESPQLSPALLHTPLCWTHPTACGSLLEKTPCVPRAPAPQICKGGDLIPASFTGQIEFRDVRFHYPSRPELPVLKGLSLLVKPGEGLGGRGPLAVCEALPGHLISIYINDIDNTLHKVRRKGNYT